MFRPIVGFVALTSLALIGCSGDSGGPILSGAGGGLGSGGNSATSNGGNAVGTGGATSGSGGQIQNQGGAVGQGGISNGLGGAVATGGQVAVGGNATGGTATGGAGNVGGNATGGKASGGATSVGGNAAGGTATGGAVNAGGVATGGKATTGGAVNAGGAATGGKATTGGTVNAGGAATGGKATTGGAATSTGGAATGGSTSNGTTPITVYMAGDSTMQPCSGTCPCGYGSQFQQYFNSNATVVDRARGGRSIQTWLYEGAVSSTAGSDGECTLTSTAYDTGWTTMLNAMKAGDWLLIGFGINDGDSACPRHVGTARFQTLLGVMATAAKAKGASVIFLTSTSAIACSGSTAQANRGFGPQTIAAGTANNVPVIDLTKISAALYTSLGLCPNSSDYTSTTSAVGKFFCADHTHFEAAGASQVAGAVAKAIKDQGIGLAAYLL